MAARNRILLELKDIHKDPLNSFNAGPAADDLFEWEAIITGPPNSPYAGGVFIVSIQFPPGYPFKRPQIAFKTRIFHPNVNRGGLISIDELYGGWSPALTISKVLHLIRSDLTDPNEDGPMDPEIMCMYKTDRNKFDTNARLWTQMYAMSQS